MKRSHQIIFALSLLALTGPLWAQTAAAKSTGTAKAGVTAADKGSVKCTMGDATIKGIDAGACATDAENDGGQGGDPVTDNDGPAVASTTSTCSNSKSGEANCYSDPNGPAHGNTPTGGGSAGKAAAAQQAAWQKSCTQQLAAAMASCSKSPNPTACNINAKNSNKMCLTAAANAAQKGASRLPPDPANVTKRKL